MDERVSLLADLGSLLPAAAFPPAALGWALPELPSPLVGLLLSQLWLNLTGLFPLFHKLT